MKLTNFTIISFLFALSSFFLSKKTVTQIIPFNHHLVTVKAVLDGEVKISTTASAEIRVETTILFESKEEDVLNYTIEQGHYELTTQFSYDEESLIIAPKRINTTILTKGKKYEPRREYTLFLPSHLRYME